MKTKGSNGLDVEALGASACRAYQRASAEQGRAWEELADDQTAWLEVASLALDLMDLPSDEQATIEVSASRLATDLYQRFQLAMARPDAWNDVPANIKLAWEAVGRHLANLIDSDGSLDIQEAEELLGEWVERKQLQTT